MRFNSCLNCTILRATLLACACVMILICPNALALTSQNAPQNDAVRDRWVATLDAKRFTVAFHQVPIVQALSTIAQKTGVPIQILLQDQPVGSAGIDPAITIDLERKEVTARTILELVVRQASDATQSECCWQTTAGGIEVGPKPRLLRASALERRAYSITDLGFKAPDFQAPPLQSGGNTGGSSGGSSGSTTSPPFTPSQNEARYQKIKSLIQSTVESDVWAESSGGPCTISVFDDKLIVIAPDFVHRAIARSNIMRTNTQPTSKPTR